VAFWAQAQKHFAGVMKAVSLVPGTEIILESTANGVGGDVLRAVGLGREGPVGLHSDLPALVHRPHNARELPIDDYEPSAEEEEYQRLYKLTDEQLCWAHFENINLRRRARQASRAVPPGEPGHRGRGVPDHRHRQLHPGRGDPAGAALQDERA
jgi:hypothetical protein